MPGTLRRGYSVGKTQHSSATPNKKSAIVRALFIIVCSLVAGDESRLIGYVIHPRVKNFNGGTFSISQCFQIGF